MFLKVLLLLTLSYFGFLLLAHITVLVPSQAKENVETFSLNSSAESSTTEENAVHRLQVKDFITHSHHTLNTQEGIVDGDLHRYNPQEHETEVAFVRQCLKEARKQQDIVGVVVDMNSYENIHCVYKQRKPLPRPSTEHRENSVRVEKTSPEDNVILFLRSDQQPIIKEHTDHYVTPTSLTKKAVIVEVDSATSAKGFELDQPTQYDETDPPVDVLDQYGHYQTPSTVWSTLQPDAPKCLDVTCEDGTNDCPVQLSNTYATPETNSRIGSILPSFTYTECR